MPTTVLVADHTDIARRAIRQLVDAHAEVRLVGEENSFAETVRMTKELKPQVLVIDVHMPDQKRNPAGRFQVPSGSRHLPLGGCFDLG